MANNSLNIWARLKLHQETSEEVHKQRTWTRIYYVYEFQVILKQKFYLLQTYLMNINISIFKGNQVYNQLSKNFNKSIRLLFNRYIIQNVQLGLKKLNYISLNFQYQCMHVHDVHFYLEKRRNKYASPVKIHLVMYKTGKKVQIQKQSFQNSLTNI